MNTQWQQFLLSQSARIKGNVEPGPWIADASHLGLVEVSGSKSSEFLQGQLTCDIKQLSENTASLGACCNPKGRMIANFYIWPNQEKFYIALPQSMVTTTIEHLKKYAIFSKVALTSLSDDIILLQYFGNPSYIDTALVSLIKIPNGSHFILGNIDAIIDCWNESIDKATPIDAFACRAFAIKNGLVFIYPTTSELFTPQMINLQKLGGVSFKKGCYVGQEIIARTEHLGQLKRHLYQLHLDLDTEPQPGSVLKNAAHEAVGTIVESAPANEGGFDLLAVIQSQMLEKDQAIYYEGRRACHQTLLAGVPA